MTEQYPFRPEKALPQLTQEMIDRLNAYGRREVVSEGAVLCRRGDHDADLFVIVEGNLDVSTLDSSGQRVRSIKLEPGQFSGEFDLLSHHVAMAETVAATDCELLRIPRSEIARLMRSEGDIANLILQAGIWRRLGMLYTGDLGVVLTGFSESGETIRIQQFLTRNRYLFVFKEATVEHHKEVTNDAVNQQFPVMQLPNGDALQRPTKEQVADALGSPRSPIPILSMTLRLLEADHRDLRQLSTQLLRGSLRSSSREWRLADRLAQVRRLKII